VAPRYQVVLLLGGVLVTMVVRAVEGQGTRDPVSHPTPPVVAGDSSGARSLDGTQVAMALRRRGDGYSPISEASFVTIVPEGSATYSEIDAARMRMDRARLPDSADDTDAAIDTRNWLTRPRKWGQVALPSYVSKALGNVQVYLMLGGGCHEEIIAKREGRLYDLPAQLNQLAADAGFLTSRGNLELVMRVYAYFLFASDRLLAWYADFDSALNGQIRLVRPFRLKMLGARLHSDKGTRHEMEMPEHGSGIAKAVVDWGDSRDTVVVVFAGSVGFEGVVFPYDWTTGSGLRAPRGYGRHLLDAPAPPLQKRGELENIEFEVVQSPGGRRGTLP